MSELILGLDPGQSTGWSLWELPPDLPVQRLEYGLIHGGLEGAAEWMENRLGLFRPTTIVCEKFNQNDGRVARADLTPLPIEGLVYGASRALGIDLVYQPTSAKDQVHDSLLREHGLYVENAEARTNPDILWQDARDVNDSEIHVLAWVKLMEHEPTIDLYWPDR